MKRKTPANKCSQTQFNSKRFIGIHSRPLFSFFVPVSFTPLALFSLTHTLTFVILNLIQFIFVFRLLYLALIHTILFVVNIQIRIFLFDLCDTNKLKKAELMLIFSSHALLFPVHPNFVSILFNGNVNDNVLIAIFVLMSFPLCSLFLSAFDQSLPSSLSV